MMLSHTRMMAESTSPTMSWRSSRSFIIEVMTRLNLLFRGVICPPRTKDSQNRISQSNLALMTLHHSESGHSRWNTRSATQLYGHFGSTESSQLVDEHHVLIDPDLDKAQSKFMHKVTKDNLLHHEAKSIAVPSLHTRNWLVKTSFCHMTYRVIWCSAL